MRTPRLDQRRTPEFSAELRERARAWIPAWALADGERDFGRALLEIAARFSSEVAEHLDNAGEKMRRGFLDWLGVRGEAARPARVPVVFKLADAAREAVLASAPVRMQADAAGASVVLETEKDVRVVPGRLEIVVGADADADAFYLPPPGLSDLEPLEPLPAAWQLKSFAAAGATRLQLDPESGLAAGTILEAAGQQYRIAEANQEIVTIEPPLTSELPEQTVLRKVAAFSPFDGKARNRQEHALYLGHMELLDVAAEATIDVVGAQALREGVTWQYWGKAGEDEEVGWQKLTPAAEEEQRKRPDAVVLTKPKGAIEAREIGGKKSRWIRAVRKTVLSGEKPFPFRPDEFGVRLNAGGCGGSVPCPPPEATASPAADAMANTTPLVLDGVFFPLGKEPRQFDAFYLGSVEAFSKKGAEIQICFEMADPTFASLSQVLGGLWGNVLAGVAADRSLHLLELEPDSISLKKFRGREPLQPPSPRFGGTVDPANSIPLDTKPPWRLPMWSQDNQDFLVGTMAGADVWIWHENSASETASGWRSFGQIPVTVPGIAVKADGLVYLDDATAPEIAALSEEKLFVRQWPLGLQWDEVPTKDGGGNPVALKAIVPVLVETASGQLYTSTAEGMIGVADDHTLHQVALNGQCTPLSPVGIDLNVRPVAVRRHGGGPLVIALAQQSLHDIITFHSINGQDPLALAVDEKVLGFDAVVRDGQLHFLATIQRNNGADLGSWTPPALGQTTRLFRAPIPAPLGPLGGGPTALDDYVVIPGTHADVLTAEIDLSRRFAADAVIEAGIVLPDPAPALVPNDVVARMAAGAPEPHTVKRYGTRRDGEVFHPIDAPFSAGASGPLLAYRASAPLNGMVTSSNELELQLNDREATVDSWLLVDGAFYKIASLDTTVDPWIATMTSNFPATGAAKYARPLPTGGRIAPFMELDPATNGKWDASLLQRVKLLHPGATPERQAAKAFSFAPGNYPILVVFAAEFTVLPPGNPTFIVDAAVGEWVRLLGDTSANPELSWEYWNGKGWWKLDITLDQTLHLKNTGAVRFKVPDDIASSDWAGKTNHWIRTRLVGGDYGREKVTVKIKDLRGGVTEQTIERSSEGIRAPSVVKLHISYRLCKAALPAFVLGQDSGSLRDQSDANRTAGAVVEAFVPLAVTLGRLSGPAAAPEAPDECPPPCQCHAEPAAAGMTPAPATPPATGASRLATGRALFIGLAAPLSGAPVNVLLLVEEASGHEQFAPMKIEALVADRFLPVVAEDTTRALGESGLLSMAFALEPTPRELFGVDNLTWLRLTPGGDGPVSEWKPTVRGAYLNAVMASAAETLTRELLGSSEGAPDLTVHLARPPVLRDSLELRVKEPLGEEERIALLREGEDRVLSAVKDLPGDWVLWRPVIDPGDEPAAARVYALDEASGEIRFGDGRHGAIPPIGRDSIVAFSYRRTELGTSEGGDVPANAIAARTALNLVSPVEGVEAVFAADQAAGGAPPETAERVLRFGTARLRHRKRALTARDFEDLALQSSPDVVQARCFARPGQTRLVVVMRGEDPQPNASEIRELRRLLLAAAPAALSAPGALRITGPRIRRLRMFLKLRLASLDHAGEVSRAVELRLRALFDTGTGGVEKEGWALGENSSEEDVALALIDTRRLEGIAGVTLLEVLPDGAERPWTGAVKRDELAMLDDDAVRFEFEVVEVFS